MSTGGEVTPDLDRTKITYLRLFSIMKTSIQCSLTWKLERSERRETEEVNVRTYFVRRYNLPWGTFPLPHRKSVFGCSLTQGVTLWVLLTLGRLLVYSPELT